MVCSRYSRTCNRQAVFEQALSKDYIIAYLVRRPSSIDVRTSLS
jgi:hypothetical protein